MLTISQKSRDYILLALFTALVFIFWKTSANFFWKDEMSAIKELMHPSIAYFMEPINGQIVPLFKLFYFFELTLFGVNTSYFTYINLFLFACTAFSMYKLLRLDNPSYLFCFLVCSITLIHPVNYNHLLWTFQVAETLQFLFQVLAVLYLMRFIRSSLQRDWGRAILCLFLQNYFFGNGVFFPILFIVALTLFYTGNKRNYILISALAFIVFIAVQLLWGKSGGVAAGLINHLPEVVKAYFYFTSITLSRFFFLSEKVFGGYILWISFFLFMGVLTVGLVNKSGNKKKILFYTIWLLVTGISVPLSRVDNIMTQQIPFYYSALSFIPFMLILSEVMRPFWKDHLPQPLLHYVRIAVIGSMLITFFIIDSKMANTYTIRSVRNEANINIAIRNNLPYYGFDDPHFCDKEHPREDGFYEYMYNNPKEVYLYWKAKTPVNLNSNLKNE